MGRKCGGYVKEVMSGKERLIAECSETDVPFVRRNYSMSHLKRSNHIGNEHASEEMNDPSQEDSNMDYEGLENRKYKRYKYIAAALLEDLVSENRVYAQMQNISYKGMYFETSASLTTGGKVRIKLDKPLFKSKSKLSKSGVSTVRWCKKLFDEEGYVYAYGIDILKAPNGIEVK